MRQNGGLGGHHVITELGGSDPLFDHLSVVLQAINEQFTVDRDAIDRLKAEKIKITLLANAVSLALAEANTAESYVLEFGSCSRERPLNRRR